jgi:hypothetical protein
MKTLKSIIIVYFVLFAFNTVSAQYGYGNNGMNGGGMNRNPNQQSIQNTNNYGRNTKSATEIEKERAENLNKTVEKLTKELSLDDLQVIVIKKEIETSMKNISAVMKSEVSDDEKLKEIEAINEKTDRTINTFLNEEQKNKYKKFIEERKERIEKYKMSRN